MIRRVIALARALVWNPVRPTSLAALINPDSFAREFREMVRLVLPDRFDEIMNAPAERDGRETAQVWAFCRIVEAELFPIYEAEEYEQILYQIPFVRHGWDYDDFHDVQFRREQEVLFALAQNPYMDEGVRVPFLEGLQGQWPEALLARVPAEGYSPRRLHAALDGTRYEAAALFVDWLWGQTNNPMLDFGQEIEVYDAEWTRENVEFFVEKWREAEAILHRCDDLGQWLVEQLDERMAALLDLIEATPEPQATDANSEGGEHEDEQEGYGQPAAA